MLLRHRRGDEAEHLGRDVEVRRVDDREPVLLLEIGEEGVLVDEAELDQMARERTALRALLAHGALEVRGLDLAASNEKLAETGERGHPSMPRFGNRMLVVVSGLRCVLNGYEQPVACMRDVHVLRMRTRSPAPRFGISAGHAVSVSVRDFPFVASCTRRRFDAGGLLAMRRAPALVLLLCTAATAAHAEDRARGPQRWLLEPTEDADRGHDEVRAPTAAVDPLSRFVAHCKRDPVGLWPIATLVPPPADGGRNAELPTLALFARAQGRTLVSLTRVQARPDAGQEIVMQRTIVSDLLAGRRFSLTVYEDHAISDAAARLMGIGTRLTLRPAGWPFRVEVLGAYDVDAGASAYVAITGVFAAPPLPPSLGR